MNIGKLTRNASFILVLVAITLSQVSCEDKNQLITFNLTVEQKLKFDTVSIFPFIDVIEGNEVFQQSYAGFTFDNEKEFETNKTNPTKVRDVQQLGITLRLDSSSTDLAAFKNISLFVSQISQPLLVLNIDSILPGQRVFTTDIAAPNAELLKVINTTNYSLIFKTGMNAKNMEPVNMDVQMRFRIKAMPE